MSGAHRQVLDSGDDRGGERSRAAGEAVIGERPGGVVKGGEGEGGREGGGNRGEEGGVGRRCRPVGRSR